MFLSNQTIKKFKRKNHALFIVCIFSVILTTLFSCVNVFAVNKVLSKEYNNDSIFNDGIMYGGIQIGEETYVLFEDKNGKKLKPSAKGEGALALSNGRSCRTEWSMLVPKENQSGNIIAKINDAGWYMNNDVYCRFDMKCTFTWKDITIEKNKVRPIIGIRLNRTLRTMGFNFRNHEFKIKIEFYKKGTNYKTRIPKSPMRIFFGDVDAVQCFLAKATNGSDEFDYYRMSDNKVKSINKSGDTWMYAEYQNDTPDADNAAWRQYSFAVQSKRLDAFELTVIDGWDRSGKGGMINPSADGKARDNKWKKFVKKMTQKYVDWFDDRTGEKKRPNSRSYIGLDDGTYYPQPPQITKYQGTKVSAQKNEEPSYKITPINGSSLTNNNLKVSATTYKYYLQVVVPFNNPVYQYKSFKITDTLPDEVSLSGDGDPKVYSLRDEGLKKVNYFKQTAGRNGGQTITLTLDENYLTKENYFDWTANAYLVEFTVKLNKNVILNSTRTQTINSQKYYYWDNQGKVVYEIPTGTNSKRTEEIESSKVRVRYPFNTFSVSVTKKDTFTGKLLKGATFYVYPYSDSEGAYETTGTKLTDKGNGTYVATGLKYSGDNQNGRFRVTETAAPGGHSLSPSPSWNFKWNGEANVKLEHTFSNQFTKFTVNVTKKNSSGSTNLPGATFYAIPYDNTTKKYDWNKKKKLTDDGNGKYHIDITAADANLKWTAKNEGKYQVVETAPPAGYQLPTDDKTKIKTDSNGTYYIVGVFTIDTSSTTKVSQSYNVKEPTVPTPGTITIRKVDKKTNADITGAVFKIYAYDAKAGKYDTTPIKTMTYNSSTKRYESGTLYRYDSDNTPAGKKQNNGKYKVVETASPDGYLTPTWSKEYTITNPTNAADRTSPKAPNIFTDTVQNTPNELIIQKKNRSGANIQGVKFAFGKSKTSTTAYTTNASGQISISPVKAGTYYIQETSAPSGYAVDSTWHTIIVKANGTITGTGITAGTGTNVGKFTLTLTNEHTQDLELTKKDAETNSNIAAAKLKTAKFTIYEGKSGGGYKTTAYANVIYSTSLNKFVDESTGKPVKLNYTTANGGRFNIVETKAPTGYLLDSNDHEFTITASPASGEGTKKVTISDPPNKPSSKFIVLKKNDNGTALQGATFAIGTSKTNTTNYTTNASGRVEYLITKAGTYYFRETAAPAGYKVDTAWKTFTVDSKMKITGTGITAGTGTNAGTYTYTMTNQHEQAVELTKKNANTNSNIPAAQLATAQFKLYEGTTGNAYKTTAYATLVYSSSLNKFVDSKTQQPVKVSYTTENGGRFKIVETKAPKGYLLDSNAHEFTITKIPAAGEGAKEITISDRPDVPTPTKFVIQKQNANGTALEGVVFEVKKNSTTTTITTNASGKAEYTVNSAGTYSFREVSAPNGYKVDNKWRTFTVDAKNVITGDGITSNGATYTYTMVNNHEQIVELVKKDVQTNEAISESKLIAAQFKVYEWKGSGYNATPYATLVYNRTQHKFVNASTQQPLRVSWTSENAGKFRIVESTAPTDYKLDTTPHDFTITKLPTTGEGAKTIEITNKEDTPEPVDFIIKKKDAAGNHVSGVVFAFGSSKTNTTDYTTNTSGIIKIESLETGTYYFKEKSAPSGYHIDSSWRSITVGDGIISGEGLTSDGNATYSFTMENAHEQELLLTKTGASNQTIDESKLATAVFELYEGASGGTYAETPAAQLIYSTSLHKFVDAGTSKAVKLVYSSTNGGRFKIKEVTPPAGYVLDASDHAFTITNIPSNGEGVKEVTITDNPNRFEVLKTNESNQPLQNVVFSFGSSKTNTTDYTTGTDGKFSLDALTPGTYYLKEKTAPTGYQVDPTWKTITVGTDGTITGDGISRDGTTFRLTVINEFKWTVELTKKDSATDAAINASALANARFALYEWSGSGYASSPLMSLKYNAATSRFVNASTGEPALVKYTDTNGGRFKIVETEAPAGYLLDSTDHEFTVTKVPGGTTNTVAVTIQNTQNVFRIKKVDSSNNNLANASFKVYQEGHESTARTLTTGADGKAETKGLAPGTWCYVETAAPEGYKLDSTVRKFTVAIDGRIEGAGVYEVKAFNGKAESLKIIKRDAETGEEWAEGSDFPEGTEFYVYEWNKDKGDYEDTPKIHVVKGSNNS